MANLFKTRYLPNYDGSEEISALNNANTAFVHTYIGDDNTGDGTREKPYRSISKASMKSGISYIVFRGVLNEAFSISHRLIGDDINQVLMTINYTAGRSTAYRFTTIGNISGGRANSFNILSTPGTTASFNNFNNAAGSKYCLCYIFNGIEEPYPASLNTNNTFVVTNPTNVCNCVNSIFIDKLSITTVGAIKYSLFLTNTVFGYGSSNLIQPNFTEDSKSNIALLRTSYLAAGMTLANSNLLFPKDSFGNETCLVTKEQRASGGHPNVFNNYDINRTAKLQAIISTGAKTSIRLITDTEFPAANWPTTGNVFIPTESAYMNNGATMPIGSYEVWSYTSVTVNGANDITLIGPSYTFKTAHNSLTKTCVRYGEVLDFTLNPDNSNEALWASDTGSYVGCFRPSVDGIINQSIPIIDVNADGSDTANAGTLMQVDANNDLIFNSLSVQLWNRLRDDTSVHIPLGSNFKGMAARSQDGSPFGYYLGKKQNLIDTTIVNPGDVLTVGAMYKIFNDSAQDVTKSILYNGIQYLPEYTFICVTGVTTFSLLNAGSGSYVKKVNADVLESIEILPYDDANTPSTFPKFSAPLMGECKLLYYTAAGATRYGKVAGSPVLFGDLAVANMITDFGNVNNQMSYYDGYAISNADQEFFTLANPSLTSPKSTYFTASIPVLRYLRREINGHFDQPYDY